MTPDQYEKLPKYAKEYILKLAAQRDEARRALDTYVQASAKEEQLNSLLQCIAQESLVITDSPEGRTVIWPAGKATIRVNSPDSPTLTEQQ